MVHILLRTEMGNLQTEVKGIALVLQGLVRLADCTHDQCFPKGEGKPIILVGQWSCPEQVFQK